MARRFTNSCGTSSVKGEELAMLGIEALGNRREAIEPLFQRDRHRQQQRALALVAHVDLEARELLRRAARPSASSALATAAASSVIAARRPAPSASAKRRT
jgi:hypothetical protein